MYKLKYHLKENVTCKRYETRIKTSLMNSIKMQAYITQKAKDREEGIRKRAEVGTIGMGSLLWNCRMETTGRFGD